MRDLAVMWRCTELQDPLDQREFGALYSMNRDGEMHRFPKVGLILGDPETPEGFHTKIPSDPDEINSAEFIIATAHTHPPHSSVAFVRPGSLRRRPGECKEGLDWEAALCRQTRMV